MLNTGLLGNTPAGKLARNIMLAKMPVEPIFFRLRDVGSAAGRPLKGMPVALEQYHASRGYAYLARLLKDFAVPAKRPPFQTDTNTISINGAAGWSICNAIFLASAHPIFGQYFTAI